jgi:hypothetical protein
MRYTARMVDWVISTCDRCQSKNGVGGKMKTRVGIAIAVAVLGFTAPASADELLVTTTGTIASGSETGGLFGLPTASTSLAGDSYTLEVTFDSLGPNYLAGGSFASDFESFPGTPGSVTATVNGMSLTMQMPNSLGSILEESLVAGFGSFDDSNNGYSSAGTTGAFATVSQDLVCGSGNSCVPAADLMTPFLYTLNAGDSGTDQYTFNGAGFPAAGTPTATFIGTETSMDFQVSTTPLPAALPLFATGLGAMGLFGWRRKRTFTSPAGSDA